jgi:hypothetical protein
MKKIILIVLIILLIALGLFFFLGNGKEKISDFFSGDTDFGSFFDIEPQSKNDFVQNPPTTPTDTTPTSSKYVAPVLRQISFEPVSGYTFYSTTSTSTRSSINIKGEESIEEFKATSTVIRFQERATGHMYDVFEFMQSPQKVSNATIQKIYNTFFSTNKNQFVYQNLAFNNEQIITSFAKLIFSTTTDTVLEKNTISSAVTDFVYNKNSNRLIYSIKQNGVSAIYTSNPDRTDEKLVTTVPFTEFILDPLTSTEVVLTTKASQVIPGYAYILNTTTGSLNKILGNIPGLLVKVSPDKKYYLYSQSEQTRPSIRSYNTKTQKTNLGTIDTIPEKCVFSQKNTSEIYCFGSIIYQAGQYPDDWYKGKVFNRDSLFKINLENNQISIIYNFDADELSFDVINPQLTANDSFMVFQSKYDLTLWSLDLNRITNEVF